MTITTITSRTDIEIYVDNSHADFVADGLRDALVAAIQAADHPDYGRDWSEWLDVEIAGIRDGVVAGLNALAEPESAEIDIATKLYSEAGGGTTLVVDFPAGIDDEDLSNAIDANVREQHPEIIAAWERLCDAGHAPIPDEAALVRTGRAEWRID